MTIRKKILTTGLTLITLIIIAMGLFDFLKPTSNNGQFVSELAFNKNRDK